jgi:hypothetical protein
LKSDHKEQETMRHYLLGLAAEDGWLSLEERLLTDSEFFQELLIVEDELIDQFLGDELSPAEREKFETHFLLAPERQRKLSFSRALHKYVNFAAVSDPLEQYSAEEISDEKPDVAKPPPKRGLFSFLPSNPIVSYSLAAAMLLLIAGVSWVVLHNWRQQTPLQPGNVYVVTLTPGLTRDGGELKRLSIPPGTNTVQLRLLLESGEGQVYRAEVLTGDRVSVFVMDDLKPQAQGNERLIILNVPANILKHDDYQVRVSSRQTAATEETGRYQLRVLE